MKIFGEICQKKQCETHTLDKLAVIIANMSQDGAISGQFKTLCDQLSEQEKQRISEVYNRCNEEVRANVMHSLNQ